MADYPISNVPRRIVYTGSAGVGPYAFEFEVLLNTDINVYKNDVLLTLTTDYTVSISPTLGTGSVTLVSAASGTDRITIVGARAVERTSDFTTGGDFFANTLNDEMDSQTILTQQVAETAERSIKAPVTDPTTINMTLPINTARAGKSLAFDADGNPVVGEPIGNFRGDWVAGVTYQIRDIVTDTSNDNVYYATQTHISSGELPIDDNVDSDKWAIVIDAGAAGEARAAAEVAQAAAEAAQAAAELAETNAETAETNAETAETNAETAATNAASSASAAATSATNSSNSATAAATSATNASNSATAAATSATNASNSATSASTSASTATTQATNASNSATAAATSATNAANSATASATSATNASNSASAASTSATNAATAQSAAEAARDQTLTAFDNFDDRYLGEKASDPALDNDGDALVAGALYFNSTDGVMKVYTGTSWVAAYVSGTGFASTSSTNTFTASQVISVTDNTNAALRVTQAGTGDALLVEDEANPDSTPFVIKNDGKVGIGTASPANALEVSSLETFEKLNSTQSGYSVFYQATNPQGSFYAGKDRDGSAGLWGSGGEYVIAGTGNYPMDFYTNSAKRMTVTGSGGISFGSSGTAYGTTGQVLTSNGNATPTWADASGAVANGTMYENGTTISSSYTLTTNKNGLSVGPITIASGATVTVPSGQRWLVL